MSRSRRPRCSQGRGCGVCSPGGTGRYRVRQQLVERFVDGAAQVDLAELEYYGPDDGYEGCDGCSDCAPDWYINPEPAGDGWRLVRP